MGRAKINIPSCVFVHGFVLWVMLCRCVCVHMWMPYVSVDICDCLPYILGQDLSLNLEPAWLPGKLQGSTSLYPQQATTASLFMGAGDYAELLRFVSPALYQLSHLPAPCETISVLPSLKERYDRVADRAVP